MRHDDRLIRDIESTLDLLSKTANKTGAQKRYRQSLVDDAQAWIDRLVRFAMLKPGRVQDNCLLRAYEKQGKLDALIYDDNTIAEYNLSILP